MANPELFDISVDTQYLDEQSRPGEEQFVFAYTIRIKNNGDQGAQLLNRHWFITDAHGKVQEVKGEGVVGEQPFIGAGESFQYTSGAILTTPVGTMQGSYQMCDEFGIHFDTIIPLFSLAKPGSLH